MIKAKMKMTGKKWLWTDCVAVLQKSPRQKQISDCPTTSRICSTIPFNLNEFSISVKLKEFSRTSVTFNIPIESDFVTISTSPWSSIVVFNVESLWSETNYSFGIKSELKVGPFCKWKRKFIYLLDFYNFFEMSKFKGRNKWHSCKGKPFM